MLRFDQGIHPLEIGPAQHLRLWKGELEYRILRKVRPVDELIEDVVVDPEGEYTRNGLHGDAIGFRQPFQLRYLVDVPVRKYAKPGHSRSTNCGFYSKHWFFVRVMPPFHGK